MNDEIAIKFNEDELLNLISCVEYWRTEDEETDELLLKLHMAHKEMGGGCND